MNFKEEFISTVGKEIYDEAFSDVPLYYLQASSVDRRLVDTIFLKGKRLLNIGCGSHLISDIYFALKGANVVAIDIDENSVDMANHKLAKIPKIDNIINLKVLLEDGRALPFEDNTFDVAVSFSAIEHMEKYEDRLRVLREMVRVVRPYGHVIVTGPNFLNIPTTILSKRVFKRLGLFEHRYMPWELKAMFMKCGLEIEEFDAESVYILDDGLINAKFPQFSIIPSFVFSSLSFALYEINKFKYLKIIGMRIGFRALKKGIE
jgi:ubiquinone/menaquinone biosynthesis C-methylase UbiE